MKTTCRVSLNMTTVACALAMLVPLATPCWVSAGDRHAEARPLLRDGARGYLLNCSFRAIRAYPWRDKVPLTGWGTDDRGGCWESSPVGFLPDQFGFHVNWFRLRDTSADAGVTIKHQIARQTSGVVTWEFRFMMPELMEGVAWQLRDMEAAAVALSVHGGRLCCERADATPLALQSIQTGREYGVRVVVDLRETVGQRSTITAPWRGGPRRPT